MTLQSASRLIESVIEIFAALAAVPVAGVPGNWIAAVVPILIYLAALLYRPGSV